jgi:hypothetical protein
VGNDPQGYSSTASSRDGARVGASTQLSARCTSTNTALGRRNSRSQGHEGATSLAEASAPSAETAVAEEPEHETTSLQDRRSPLRMIQIEGETAYECRRCQARQYERGSSLNRPVGTYVDRGGL